MQDYTLSKMKQGKNTLELTEYNRISVIKFYKSTVEISHKANTDAIDDKL